MARALLPAKSNHEQARKYQIGAGSTRNALTLWTPLLIHCRHLAGKSAPNQHCNSHPGQHAFESVTTRAWRNGLSMADWAGGCSVSVRVLHSFQQLRASVY